MKKELFGLIFTIFLTTLMFNIPMRLGSIRYDEDNPSSWILNSNIDNRQNDVKMKRVGINTFFPDLGILSISNRLDIGSGDVSSIKKSWEEVPSGEHLVRICAHNDLTKKCTYRYIDFI